MTATPRKAPSLVATHDGSMSDKDQRKCLRVPFVGAVRYSAAGVDFESHAANLSRQGIFIEAPSPPPPGTPLSIVFEVDGHEIMAEGVVANVHPPAGFGVELKLPEDAHEVVVKYVARKIVATFLTDSE